MCRSQGRPIHRPGALFGEVPCHARFVQPMGRLLLPPALLTHCLRGEETGIRKTMKNYLLAWLDNIPLRKRFIIETLFDALNSSQGLEHSRHRSPPTPSSTSSPASLLLLQNNQTQTRHNNPNAGLTLTRVGLGVDSGFRRDDGLGDWRFDVMAIDLTASAPAFRRGSRRSRGWTCGRASRLRRILPRAGRGGISNPPGPRREPASPKDRYRDR
jgi:hypothetical protein